MRTSIDSDSPKTTPSSTNRSLNGDDEMDDEEATLVRQEENEEEETPRITTPVGDCGSVADKCGASAQISSIERNGSPSLTDSAGETHQNAAQLHQPRLSPRLEMRLALNHDILGDEDLMTYSPGPNLTSILGRDLSSYHRMTGKDIIMNRIMNRRDIINNYSSSSSTNHNSTSMNIKNLKNDPMNSFCQQNNSKMDTPILNRKSNQHTWNNSGYARRGKYLINIKFSTF